MEPEHDPVYFWKSLEWRMEMGTRGWLKPGAWAVLGLAVLLLLPTLQASMTSSGPASIALQTTNQKPEWETFTTDATFNAKYTLMVPPSGGPVRIITPGVDPADLPGALLMCPGKLTLKAEPQASWDNTAFVGNSPFDPNLDKAGRLPPQPWAPPGGGFPVQWSDATLVTCANGANKELLDCMNLFHFSSKTNTGAPIGEWSQVLTTGIDVNVHYRVLRGVNPPWPAPPPAPNTNFRAAEGDMVCDGTVNVGSQSSRLSGMPAGPASFTLDFPSPGDYPTPAYLDINACQGVVHQLPEPNSASSNKFYYWIQTNTDPLPAVKTNKATFDVTVVNPTTCVGNIVSVTPSTLNVNAGQTATVVVRVSNPQTGAGAVYIRAVGVSASNGWTAAPSPQPPPNNFNKDIAPGATTDASSDLRVDLTAPTPLGAAPVLTILFQSSTPLCNNAVCNSKNTFTFQTPTTCGCTVAPSAGQPGQLTIGQDTELTAACQCGGNAVACPALNWAIQPPTADASIKSSVVYGPPVNQGKYNPPPPGYQLTATTAAIDPPKAELVTYDGTKPPWKTSAPQTIQVQVGGTLQGNAFTCQLAAPTNGIPVVPPCGCAITTDSATNIVVPGKDLGVSATCSCNGKAATCPALTWTHTFKNDVSLDKKTDYIVNGKPSAPPFTSSVITTLSPHDIELVTYDGTVNYGSPGPNPLTSAPQSGNVKAAGTLNGQAFSCQAAGDVTPIQIAPPCGCALSSADSSGRSTSSVAAGSDLTFTAACACNGKSAACPALAWKATGFSPGDLDLKAAPGLPKRIAPPPPKYSYSANTVAQTPLPSQGEQAVLQTFAWSRTPDSGNVQATGSLNGQAFTCVVPGGATPINIVPPCGCALTTDSTNNNHLLPGKDLGISAACSCNGKTTGCPALTWTHTFKNDVSLDKKFDYLIRPGNKPSAPPFTPSVTTTLSPHDIELVTYDGTVNYGQPGPNPLTSAPQSGNVIASGTMPQGQAITCQVGGSSDKTPIVIGDMPDYVPVVSADPGWSVPVGKIVTVKVHTLNQGGGAATVSSFTDSYLPAGSATPIIHENVPALAKGAQTADVSYVYTCGLMPQIIVGSSTVNVGNVVDESDYSNNVAKWAINCGAVLACPDYI